MWTVENQNVRMQDEKSDVNRHCIYEYKYINIICWYEFGKYFIVKFYDSVNKSNYEIKLRKELFGI